MAINPTDKPTLTREIELFAVRLPTNFLPSIFFTFESEGVSWGGNFYTPMIGSSSGFGTTTVGTMPRPTLELQDVANLFPRDNGFYQERQYEGSRVYRRRTWVECLPGSPTADPLLEMPVEVWILQQIPSLEYPMIKIELAAPIDLDGQKYPSWLISRSYCRWGYKGPECQWAGGPRADIFDTPTNNPVLDQCSQSLEGCRARYGADRLPLRFSGFAGAQYG